MSQISLASLAGWTAYRRVSWIREHRLVCCRPLIGEQLRTFHSVRTQVRNRGPSGMSIRQRWPKSGAHCRRRVVIGPLKCMRIGRDRQRAGLLGVSGFIRSGTLHIGADATEVYLEMHNTTRSPRAGRALVPGVGL